MIRFWYPAREYLALKNEIDNAVQDVMSRGDLILRKDVELFEKEFARAVGVKHAVGVNSGTDALILALEVAGIKKGDEVITTSYTFRATVGAILRVGATPVLADYGEDWKDYATEKTRAIIPVHIAGEILPWKPEGEIVMIEDACQALTAGPVNGSLACYSFYPAKILGCAGDGGAVVTNNDEYAEKLRRMRNLFKGYGDTPAYNSRLDNLQAAILLVKVKHLTDFIQKRKHIALMYDEALHDLIGVPVPRAIYQDYIVETKDAAALHDFLNQRGVETMLNEYQFPDVCPKLPKAQAHERRTLRLPCTPYHTREEIESVIEGVKAFVSQRRYD